MGKLAIYDFMAVSQFLLDAAHGKSAITMTGHSALIAETLQRPQYRVITDRIARLDAAGKNERPLPGKNFLVLKHFNCLPGERENIGTFQVTPRHQLFATYE